MERWVLQQRQSLPLDAKVRLSEIRIRAWYSHFRGQVYVSFSGGKDSTVLLHIVRSLYSHIPAVFVDTGLEYPEIRDFVKTIDDVTWLKPKMNFKQVIDKYGFPVVTKENAQKIHEIRTTKSDKLRNKRLFGDDKGNGKLPEKWKFLIDAPFKISHQCCDVMKKRPVKSYEKKTGRMPMVGTMACESSLRVTNYLRHGCNSFDGARPCSAPMAFWLEEDVYEYLRTRNVPYSPIYDMGYERTGCVFCMFGVHLDKGQNRFQKMAKTHPRLHSYCLDKLNIRQVMDTIGVPYE